MIKMLQGLRIAPSLNTTLHLLVIFLLLSLSAVNAAGADLKEPAPFSLEKKTVIPVKTIDLKNVKINLNDGIVLQPAEFTRTINLNGTWKCSGLTNSKIPFPADVDLNKKYESTSFDDSGWDDIAVPLDWYKKYPAARKTDGSGISQTPYVKGWYRKTINLNPDALKNLRVMLNFGVIGYEAKLFVNGKEAGEHHGDFTPWSIDVTDLVKAGDNKIAIRVLSDFGTSQGTIEKAVHTYGSQWSIGNIRGGLWQDVKLSLEPEIHVERVLVSPILADSSIEIDYLAENPAGLKKNLNLRAIVYSAMQESGPKVIADYDAGKKSPAPGSQASSLKVKLDQPQLWTLDKPYLYYLTLCLTDGEKIVSAKTVRFGFRDFKIKGKDFYLNGERIYLFGENTSSITYGGHGKKPAEEYAKLLTELSGYKALGYNMIRNAHMPIVPEALEIADEIGLMIYDEWAWSFTKEIIEDEFEKRNLKELREWVYRDYNHPSVVMWSCGNEVVHKFSEAVKRQLDKQVELVRKLDKSGRPVGSFSGTGSWPSYGKAKMATDFVDLHDYCALSGLWTKWEEGLNTKYKVTDETYRENGKFNIPYIIWECVGFSWGDRRDTKFKLNDIDKYAEYASRKTSWGNPNGIGFAGVIGLEAALDPNKSNSLGRKIYGKRIIEQIRQDTRVQGFAPWFHDYKMTEATIWNQPVFCSIRSENGVPIRNVFCGRKYEQEFILVNSSNRELNNLTAEFYLVTKDGKTGIPIAKLELPQIKPWEKIIRKIKLPIPNAATPSRAQLRMVVREEKSEVSRNFYGLYLQDENIVNEKLPQNRTVGVFRSKSETAVKLNRILDSIGVKYELIDAKSDLAKYNVAIVPPGISKSECHSPETLLTWIKHGGILVELEQSHNGSDIVDQSNIGSAPQTFVDIAIPEHPIFKNLDQQAFDTWNNPDHGYVINYALSPFSLNALAVRMSSLGGNVVANAVAESTLGKGRLLQGQLAAINLWDIDSAATTYLHNLLDYTVSGKLYAKTRPIELKRNQVSVCPERLFAVDLKPYVNQGFADEKDQDGKGGWTDQGNNDFRMMPVGKYKLKNLVFDIIDPAKNGGKSCIVLKGKERPAFPIEKRGIKVGQAAGRLFFLHANAWGKSGQDVGSYRINYQDGTTATIPLIDGFNTADWWSEPNIMEKAVPALRAKNKADHEVGLFLYTWDNPDPAKIIDSIDFISAGGPMPVLVAVSGEKSNPRSVMIDNGEDRKKWSILSWKDGGNNGKNPPHLETVERKNKEADVFRGECAVKAVMATTNEQGQPVAFTRFDPAKLNGDDYQYITFWAKPATYCVIEVVLPDKNWKNALRTTVPLVPNKRNEWQKIRLSLKDDMKMEKGKFDLKDLRGEFFIYSALADSDISSDDKNMQFLMDEITLE